MYKLRSEIFTIGDDLREVFSGEILKSVIIIVFLNIVFSYGMLYLSDYVLNLYPAVSLNSALGGGLLVTIFVSPISEELIFRGVFLNRLKLVVPTLFAVLISSLLFASLHSFGSIFSAFIFALCMAILYLKTDNIFVPIFAHFLNNLFAEIIVYIGLNTILFNDFGVMVAMSVLAVVSFVLILISIVKELNTINNNNF